MLFLQHFWQTRRRSKDTRSSTQHAGVTGPTRPKGSVLLANVKTSPGRHPAGKISGWSCLPDQSTYYGLSTGAHRVFKPPSKGAFVGSCMYGIFGFFRLGELCPETASQADPTASIMWGDVAVDSRENLTMVRIHLKRSKWDLFGVGANIILGRTGQSLCLVTLSSATSLFVALDQGVFSSSVRRPRW